MHGYSALHLIIRISGIEHVESVVAELQIRTPLQHLWAELNEKIADRYGRGIRYGEPPEHPERPLFPDTEEAGPTRADLVGLVLSISELIRQTEEIQVSTEKVVAHLEGSDLGTQFSSEELDELGAESVEAQFAARHRQLMSMLEELLDLVTRLEA